MTGELGQLTSSKELPLPEHCVPPARKTVRKRVDKGSGVGSPITNI